MDFSRVEEELLPTELTPNSLIRGIKKSTFSIGRKLTKDLQVFNRATESFPTELLLIVKKEVKKRWQCSLFAKNFYRNEFEGILVLIISILGSAKF